MEFGRQTADGLGSGKIVEVLIGEWRWGVWRWGDTGMCSGEGDERMKEGTGTVDSEIIVDKLIGGREERIEGIEWGGRYRYIICSGGDNRGWSGQGDGGGGG